VAKHRKFGIWGYSAKRLRHGYHELYLNGLYLRSSGRVSCSDPRGSEFESSPGHEQAL